MKRIVFALFLAGLLLTAFACGSDDGFGGGPGSLVGVWTATDSSDAGDIGGKVTFYHGGAVEWFDHVGSYAYGGNDLTLFFSLIGNPFHVEWLTADSIRVNNIQTDYWVILVRKPLSGI